MTAVSPILVRKLDIHGGETFRYSGEILEKQANFVRLEARFNRDDMHFHGMLLGRGDRFVESFYTDRWYNVFEIHDRQDDALKGWYCNVGYPAVIDEDSVSYRDLALDLLVFPDGRQIVLDEEEFASLPLAAGDRECARQALAELQGMFVDLPSL
jgi:hypothetical protein